MCEGYYCFYSGCRDNPFEIDRCKSLSEPLFCPMWKVVDDKKRNGDCRDCRERDYKKKKMNANKVERSDGRDERNQAEPEGQRIVEWRAQSTRAIADSPSGYAGQPEPDNSRRSNRPDSRIITPSPQDDHPRPSQASARSAEILGGGRRRGRRTRSLKPSVSTNFAALADANAFPIFILRWAFEERAAS